MCVFVCVRIQDRHAVFRNEQRRVTLTPLAGSKVIVNGSVVNQTTELQHLVGLNTNFMIQLCYSPHLKCLSHSLLFPFRTVSSSVQTVLICSLVIRLREAGMTGAAMTTITFSLNLLLLRASTSVSGRGSVAGRALFLERNLYYK